MAFGYCNPNGLRHQLRNILQNKNADVKRNKDKRVNLSRLKEKKTQWKLNAMLNPQMGFCVRIKMTMKDIETIIEIWINPIGEIIIRYQC